MSKAFDPLVLETAGIPPDMRLEVLRAAMGELYDIDLLHAPHEACLVSMRAVNLGQMTLVDIDLAGPAVHHARRKHKTCRRDGADYVHLQVCRRGMVRGEAGGRDFVHRAGDVLVTDMAQSSQTWSGDAGSSGLTVPRDLMRRHVPGFEALHGSVLSSKAARVLGDHVVSLSHHLGKADPADREMISEASLVMLARLLTPQARLTDEARRLKPSVQLYRALRFIELHYRDPSLDVRVISQVIGVPRSTLYRLFEPAGGINRHITSLRLSHAFTTLSDPGETRSVSNIAFDLGFRDPGHFSRSFKRRYGLTPRDVRAGARPA